MILRGRNQIKMQSGLLMIKEVKRMKIGFTELSQGYKIYQRHLSTERHAILDNSYVRRIYSDTRIVG